MDIGVFQLLPRGRAATDRQLVEQAFHLQAASISGVRVQSAMLTGARPHGNVQDEPSQEKPLSSIVWRLQIPGETLQ